MGRDAIRIKHPGCKEGILGLPVPRSPKLGSTRVIAGRVPELAMGAKKNCQKAQSPEIRGFGVFDVQDFFNEVEVSGVRYVPDAGSWCIEAVHGHATLWRSERADNQNVAGGLPPIAVCQSASVWLIHRNRGQAPSHI